MAGRRAMSEGAEATVRISRNPFIQTADTTEIRGQQDKDATEYQLENQGASISVQISQLEQIVEYLKALYR